MSDNETVTWACLDSGQRTYSYEKRKIEIQYKHLGYAADGFRLPCYLRKCNPVTLLSGVSDQAIRASHQLK